MGFFWFFGFFSWSYSFSWKADRDGSSFHLVTLQMPAWAGVGPAWSQELGTPAKSPVKVQGPNDLGSILPISPGVLAGGWMQSRAARTRTGFHMGWQRCRQLLNLRHNASPFSFPSLFPCCSCFPWHIFVGLEISPSLLISSHIVTVV